jgi:hypothetical protein
MVWPLSAVCPGIFESRYSFEGDVKCSACIEKDEVCIKPFVLWSLHAVRICDLICGFCIQAFTHSPFCQFGNERNHHHLIKENRKTKKYLPIDVM